MSSDFRQFAGRSPARMLTTRAPLCLIEWKTNFPWQMPNGKAIPLLLPDISSLAKFLENSRIPGW